MLSQKYQVKAEINGPIPKLILCCRGPWLGLVATRWFEASTTPVETQWHQF